MAAAEQLRALVRSHFSEDPERFTTTALQVAATRPHVQPIRTTPCNHLPINVI